MNELLRAIAHIAQTNSRTGSITVGLSSLIAMTAPASAVLIDFDSQGLSGPSFFAAACAAEACPQTVVVSTSAGNVTFTGGVILTNVAGLTANRTSVYGTASFSDGLVDPITITFQNPVTNFLIDVLNGLGATTEYTVSDNAGNSETFILDPGGATTIGFAATGDIVNVESLRITFDFDFFIDNIQFNVTQAPEPGTIGILGGALTGFAVLWRRRRTL